MNTKVAIKGITEKDNAGFGSLFSLSTIQAVQERSRHFPQFPSGVKAFQTASKRFDSRRYQRCH